VVTIERDGSRRANAMHWRKPLVVLIDEGTRSGKEVMAYGLKRLGVPIVGTTSAGAVVAGAAYLLPDDSFLYLAVADILVEGRRLEGQGVEPTVLVDMQLPFGTEDLQLEAALATALDRVNAGVRLEGCSALP
jgi:carboxyl-terminal processing protease